MDWTVIVGALISGTVSLVVCLITQFAQNKVTRALLEYRLGKLEEKVDRHNNIIERTYILEEKVSETQRRVKELEDK